MTFKLLFKNFSLNHWKLRIIIVFVHVSEIFELQVLDLVHSVISEYIDI